MLVNILRWIKGYVQIEGVGSYPERFINITVRNGIYIWKMSAAKNRLSGFVSASDYRQIRPYARKAQIKTRIVKKQGLPFIVRKYKKRTGLLAGLVLFVCVIAFLSQFVWSIQINGAENISTTYIMQVLSENGLYEGVYYNSLDVRQIQRNVLLEIDGIRWMSINLDGCTATVEIKEKAEIPKIDDDSYPCNIKASKDGVITSVKCSNGVVKVKEGSAVAKGQLLVSAVAENKMGGYTLLHSKAEIIAKTFENKNFNQSINTQVLQLKDDKSVKEAADADFFFFKFPLKPCVKESDTKTVAFEEYRLNLNDVILPLGLTQEISLDLYKKEKALSEQETKKAFENSIALYEAFERSDAKVLSRKIQTEKKGESACCDVSYVFEEDIAQTEKLQTS